MCLLLVSFLPMSGLIGCGEKSEPVAQKRRADGNAGGQESTGTSRQEVLKDEVSAPAISARQKAIDDEHNRRMLRVLEKALQDEDASVRSAAASALRYVGTAAIPVLETALRDDDRQVRSGAAFSLRDIGAEAIPALERALRDEDPRVYPSAAMVLQMMGKEANARGESIPTLENALEKVMPAMEKALQHEDKLVSVRAAQVLGRMGEAKRVIPIFENTLQDEDQQVRYWTVNSMLMIKEEAQHAIPLLEKALQDVSGQVRGRAIYALRGIGAEGVPALERALRHEDRTMRQEAVQGLADNMPAAMPALETALQHSDAALRSAAASALGRKTEAEQVMPILERAFQDEEAQVRSSVASALGNIGTEAIPMLEQALQDKDRRVRSSAASALRRFGAEAIPAIQKALQNEDRQVRLSAVSAFGDVGPEAVPVLEKTLEDEDFGVSVKAAETLGRMGKATKAIPLLERTLQTKTQSSRSAAVNALAMMGEEAVPVLKKALQHEDQHVRFSAASGLGRMRYQSDIQQGRVQEPTPTLDEALKDAVPVLTEALHDKDRQVRQAAAMALSYVGLEALPVIEEGLDDEDQQVRRAAARCLWGVLARSEDSLPVFEKALQDEDREVRAEAAVALDTLVQMGPKAIPLLEKALQDEDGSVRQKAFSALRRMGTQAKGLIPLFGTVVQNTGQSVPRGAVEALKYLGPEAIPVLEKALQSTDKSTRTAAAHALGHVALVRKRILDLEESLQGEDQRACLEAAGGLSRLGLDGRANSRVILERALHSEDQRVRLNAAYALEARMDRESIPTLQEALRHEDLRVRVHAAAALGRWGETQELVPTLEQALRNEDPQVCLCAAHALGRMKARNANEMPVLQEALQDAIPTLLNALQCEDQRVRVDAATALGQWGETKKVLPALEQALRDDDVQVCLSAFRALEQIKARETVEMPAVEKALRDATPAFEKALRHEDGLVRYTAAAALEQIGAEAATPVFEKALQDQDQQVRLAAVHALGRIGEAEKAIPILVKALGHEDRQVRLSTAQVLERMKVTAEQEIPGLEDALQAAIPIFEDAGQDENQHVRLSAASALGRMGEFEKAMPVLEKALRDEDSHARYPAAEALGQMGTEAISVLERALDDENRDVRYWAIYALRNIGPEAATVLEKALQQQDQQTSPGGSVQGRSAVVSHEMRIAGTTVDGKPFDWKSYRGKVVLVDFWASWCPHCWPETANARKAYELYHDRGFDVVGINLDQDTAKMNAYLEKEKVPWTNLHAKGAGGRHPVAVQYGIRSVPTMYLVDRDGKIVSLNARGKNLTDLLNKLLGPAGGVETQSYEDILIAERRGVTDLCLGPGGLVYFVEHFDGAIGCLDKDTRKPRVILQDLKRPNALAAVGSDLYFVEIGTRSGKFHDGTLSVLRTKDGTKEKICDGLHYPSSLFIDGKGAIYVLESGTFGGRTRLIRFLSGQTEYEVVIPDVRGNAVVLDSEGNIFIGTMGKTAPGDTGQLVVYPGGNGPPRTVVQNLPSIHDMEIDDQDNIFIAGMGGDRGKKIAVALVPQGASKFTTLHQGHQTWALALDPSGNIYYSTLRGSNSIRMLRGKGPEKPRPDAPTAKRLTRLPSREKAIDDENAGPQPPLAIAPFNAEQARAHQEAWAKHLGVDVDYTNSIGMKFRLIPPGEFLMGSTEEEKARFLEEAEATNDRWSKERLRYEGPQHRVRITRPYYLGKYEVTQGQWQAVMGNNPSRCKESPAHPVEQVSWDAVQLFLAKLNGRASAEKMRFALPSEAQWELACRAGTTTVRHCGDSEAALQEHGWVKANSGGKTHPVGQLRPNAFGLYDVHGNVWECCADWYTPYARAPVDDPSGRPKGTLRVNRGGSWNGSAVSCRSARRDFIEPHRSFNFVGFRMALVLPSAQLAEAGDPESKTPAIPTIPPEQVEVVADTAQVKLRDEVIASVGKGEKFAVVRRDGSWVAIDVGSGNNERIGWVWARQVQTVVPPDITEESTAPGSPMFVQVSVDSTQIASSFATGGSQYVLYCHMSIDNGDVNAAHYDAAGFTLEVDGQAVKHDVSNRQRYSEFVRRQGEESARIRRAAEVEYLQAGQIPAGGQAIGWLRFKLPAIEQRRDLAKKTWTLTGKAGERPFSIDLRQAELDALAAKVRPAALDDSVSVVEIGGSRLNGLNVGRLLELIKPLVDEGQGFVVVMTDEHCIADTLVWSQVSSATYQSRDMVAWANIPSWLKDYMGISARSSEAFFSSEAEAVIQILGKRQGGGARLTKHLNNDESATRVAAAQAMGQHTAEPGVVDALVKAATNADVQTRVAAMSSLGNSTDAKAMQAVIKGMSDVEATVRVAAACAAGSQEAQTVVEPLVRLLDDSEADVVIAASAGLGALKSQEAVPRIKELQASEDQRVSVAATDALKAIGVLSSLDAARVKLGTARLSADELDALAEAKYKTVVPELIAQVQVNQGADLSFSDRLARAAGGVRDLATIRRLREEMESNQKADRSYTNQLVRVLGDIGDPRAVDPLLGLLRDSPIPFEELPTALGKLGDERAIKPLEEALESGRVAQPFSCVLALLMLDAPGILDRLSADLRKHSNQYRAESVKQLLEILTRRRDPQAIALIEFLLDSSQHHRSAALSLFEIGTPAAIESVRSRLLTPDYPHAGGVLAQAANAAKLANEETFTAQAVTSPQFGDQLQKAASLASFLRDMKNSPNLSARGYASRYVNETAAGIQQGLAESGVVDAVVKAASDEDAVLRSAAVSSLAHTQAPQATKTILGALSDADARVRSAAATAAGNHQGEAIVDSLIKLLGDPDIGVVIGACGSLGMLKAEKAVESIRELQSADDTRVASTAIDALKAIGAVTNLDAARAKLGMVRLVTDELDALAEARDKAVVPKLIAEMQSNQKTSRSYTDQLVKVLGDIGDTQAVEPLIALLNQRSDPPPGNTSNLPLYGSELPTALGKLGDKRAIEPLEDAMAKESNRKPAAPSTTGRTQRHSFLAALLRLEAPGIVERIAEEIKGTKSYELSRFLEILGRSGGPQVVPLIEPLLDNPQRCHYAAGALVQVGSPEAMELIKTRLMSKDYPHARSVVSQLRDASRSSPSQQEPAEQVQKRLDQRYSLLKELADSPNPEVREIVPYCLSTLEHRLAANDLRAFTAHISTEDFDAADEAFQEVITKSVAAIDDDPSHARRIAYCLNRMRLAYTHGEQTERAERQFARAGSALEDAAEKSDAPDPSGQSLDLRGLQVISALYAKTPIDDKMIRQLLGDLESFLGGKAADDLTTLDLSIGGWLAHALHRTERIELAIETYKLLGETASRGENMYLTGMATSHAGAAKRLGLLGKKIDIKGTTLDGNPLDWDAYQGKVVLIDFWSSSYHGPDLANTRKAYESYHGRGFDVVSINLDENTDRVNAYLKRESVPWTILHTKGVGRKHPMAVECGIQNVPMMLLIGRDGKVVSVEARGENLNKLLNDLIGPAEPSE
ncbi:MAG: HEAT repeat domain-containing protein [Planctomycetes bacterium]|nr:HEAT repeat domain-containing protein [Planctomycetota bacterium]MBL7040470.1 HEAT repeat domain-containing protein [Pirellulaceae bacterium]